MWKLFGTAFGEPGTEAAHFAVQKSNRPNLIALPTSANPTSRGGISLFLHGSPGIAQMLRSATLMATTDKKSSSVLSDLERSWQEGGGGKGLGLDREKTI